ncbi:16084_t:CDS:2 [Dentiscutata heterogama]|uniref:16084_t:CDS:1 n=1 Tax=Dentiscutata heterogama TaxID=1316150 RepID=A0ACA9MUF8_9GLOM|nr:16084_t:CDS:2 [Dentiscutata heterogama]
MDPKIKEYIDNACQATMSMLIEKVKELIGQQAETQRQWNEQMQNTMNERFNKLEQVGMMSYVMDPNNNHANEEESNNQTITTICSPPEVRENIPQGNYPPTSLLNNMIVNAGLSDATICTNGEPIIAKNKARKYLSINYSTLKQLPTVQGLWKSIAFGSYIELTEFAYKNIKESAKYHHDDLPLQASEGGYIAIRK